MHPTDLAPALAPISLALSDNEHALWLETQMRPDFPGHLLPIYFRLEPEPSTAELAAALQRVAERFVRMRMAVSSGPTFTVSDVPILSSELCSHWPSGPLLLDLAFAPINLSRGPLLRWRRIETPDGVRHLVTAHHLLGDQRSLSGLCACLLQELSGLSSEPPPAILPRALLPLSEVISPQRWQAGFLHEALLADRPDALPSGLALHCSSPLSGAQTLRMRSYAKAHGLSQFECLLDAYAQALDQLFGARARVLWLPALAENTNAQYDVRSTAILLEPGAQRAALLAAQVRARAQLSDVMQAPANRQRHAILHTRAPAGLPTSFGALAANLEGQRIAELTPGAVAMVLYALPAAPAPFASCAQLFSLAGAQTLSLQMERKLFDQATAELLLETWKRCALQLGAQNQTAYPAATRIAAPPAPLAQLLHSASLRHGEQIALDDGTQRLSYRALYAYAQSSEWLALAACGHLTLADPSSLAQAKLFYAAMLTGTPLICAPEGSLSTWPCDTAAVFQTSGSTGESATIFLSASALAHYATSMAEVLRLAPGDRVLRFASIRFDASLEELLVSFLSGATVVCPQTESGAEVPVRGLSFPQFAALLSAQRINALNVATAWFCAAVRERIALPTGVKQVVIGGEACDADAWRAFRAQYPEIDLVNTYGLTEACVSQTWFRGALSEAATIVPLGWPLAHVTALVMPPEFARSAGMLEPGELCLSGPSLARSSRSEVFQTLQGAVVLRTGDRVRRDARGVLHYLGRLDQLVKFLGTRVDLHALSQAASKAQGHSAQAQLVGSAFDGWQAQPGTGCSNQHPQPGTGCSDPQLLIAHFQQAQPALLALAREHGAQLCELALWPRTVSGKTDLQALRHHLHKAAAREAPLAQGANSHASAFEQDLFELTGQRCADHLRMLDIMNSLTWLRLRSRLEAQYQLTVGAHAFELSVGQIKGQLDALQSPTNRALEAGQPATGCSDQSLLHHGFLRQAGATPHALALISGELRHDYAWLRRAVQSAQALLQQAGARAGERVAFHAERSVFDVVAMLAISALGAAFVPLAANADSRERMLQAGAQYCLLPDRVCKFTDPRIERIEVIADLAYVLFTSGSSGAPKAVAVTHAAAMNTLHAVAGRLGLRADDRVLALSPTQFDLSIFDVFATLGAGAALLWPDEAERTQPARWPELIQRHRVSIWNSVPSSLALLLAVLRPQDDLTCVREVMLSGDFVSRALLERAATRLCSARISVLGGATEAGIWSCVIDAADCQSLQAPYGPALAGQQLWVDASVGDVGEVLIAGASLAAGYLQNGRLSERFAPHHRTGDLGRANRDGTIEILGRADQQVKWRGIRVSVAATEASLQNHPAVQAACVQNAGDALVAVLQLAPGSSVAQVRAHWRSSSVDELTPEQWLTVAAMPRTENGKLDRLAVRRLIQSQKQAATAEVPDSENRQLRARELWQRFLPHAKVPEQGDWFTQGGHSLLALRLVEAALIQGAERATLGGFLAQPTLATVAAWFAPLAQPSALNGRAFSPALLARLRTTHGAILLTGATGMLAGSLAKRLLQSTQNTLILGVRAEHEASAAQRLPGLESARQIAIPINLAQAQFGLDEVSFSALGQALGTIWHLAAEVNFLLPAGDLEAANVRSLRALHALASVRGAHLHFTSTLGVFPYQLSQDVDELSARPLGLFASGYAESKWRAELLLHELSGVPAPRTVPISIYRLGLVAGPSARASDILGLAINALRCTQSWPQLAGELNVLDHDDAASALLLLAAEPTATWHLQNQDTLSFAAIAAQIAPQWPKLALYEWLERLQAKAHDQPTRLASELLRLLLPAVSGAQSPGHVLATHTQKVLRRHNWQPKPVLQILRRLIDA